MSTARAAWAAAMVVSVAGLACGSSVSIESTGTGGSGAGGSGGASSAQGGASSAQGGASTGEAGGNMVGGAGGVGGIAAGGAPDGGNGGGSTCPGFGDTCTECLSTGCAQVYCDCQGEPHCFGYLQCLGTCMMGDAACAQSCASVHQPGISMAILTADCAATTCDASCAFGKALPDCQKCLYTECDQPMNACLADVECVALIQCLQICAPGDGDCTQACVQQHPSGLVLAQAVRDCRLASCDQACP